MRNKIQDPIERFYAEYDWFSKKGKIMKKTKKHKEFGIVYANNKKGDKMPCGKKKGGKK